MNWQDWEEFREHRWVPVMRGILKVALLIGIGVAVFLRFQDGDESSSDSNQPAGTSGLGE